MPHRMHCVYWQREMVIDYCSTYYTIEQQLVYGPPQNHLGFYITLVPTLLISEMETSANNSQAASLNILRMLFAFHLCLVIWKNSSLARKRQVSLIGAFHLNLLYFTFLIQFNFVMTNAITMWWGLDQLTSVACPATFCRQVSMLGPPRNKQIVRHKYCD